MSRTEAIGRFLFRIRSYSPVPIIAAILVLLVRDRALLAERSSSVDAALGALGLLACTMGQALRAWVLGQVRNGTSGQNDYLEAVALNTGGPYAHVRNPLYVGNFLICAGLVLIAGDPAAGVLGLGFFAFEYAFIVPAEEGFLREKFGEAFESYCRSVPRWLWRRQAANDVPLSSHFDWRRALRKEHNPLAAWGSGVLMVIGLKAYARGGEATSAILWTLAVGEAVLLVLFAAIKGWKRGWWLSRPS